MAHPVTKIIQPTAYGPLATRRYGTFSGKSVPVITPPNRATFGAWTADATFSAWPVDATYSEDS